MKIVQWDDKWLVCHIGPWWFCGLVGRIGLKWSMTGCWWRKGFHLLPIGDFVCDNGDKLLELVEKILKAPRDYAPARAIVNGTVAYEGHLWGARRMRRPSKTTLKTSPIRTDPANGSRRQNDEESH